VDDVETRGGGERRRVRGVSSARRARSPDERSSRGVDGGDAGGGERVWGFRARRRGGRGKTVDDGGASVERREGGSGVE